MPILQQDFFNRPTLIVARELLGKFLVRRIGAQEMALMITEVEAYDGLRDKASHASRRETQRNKIMFGPAGFWYVYFTYGMHWMLNVVTREAGYPAAVLLRGVDGVIGPGRLTKHYKIDKKFNACEASVASGLWIEDRGFVIKPGVVKKTPRIGVAYAGEVWSQKPWRFLFAGKR